MCKKKKIILLLLVLSILFLNFKYRIEDRNSQTKEEKELDIAAEDVEVLTKEEILNKNIRKKIDNLSLRQKIGQLLIVGFEGQKLDAELEKLISQDKVGGLIYFSRNIHSRDQVYNLNKEIMSLNKRKENIPLFISIDEEGGSVSRLTDIYGKLPTMKSLGEENDSIKVYDYGKLLGLRLKSLGFNMNFAPVLDVNSNKDNPVIGSRSFGDNPNIVSYLGKHLRNGMEDENIIACGKHFPGHGDTDIDSHLELPKIDKTIGELEGLELLPFKNSINEGIDMIMVGHLYLPKVDKEIATFSEKIKKDILRDDLEFNGVTISDDLTMGAINKEGNPEEVIYRFLKTGGDIGLYCHNTENVTKIIDYIEEKVLSKDISVGEIDEKVFRILYLKEKYDIDDNLKHFDNEIFKILNVEYVIE